MFEYCSNLGDFVSLKNWIEYRGKIDDFRDKICFFFFETDTYICNDG